jgi:MSHA pilin protein MshA
MKSQSGFTLIEMVAVIIILAIMAATALPRFTNLTGEARVSAVAGIGAAMSSAKTLAKAKWQVANSGNLTTVDMGGTFISVISTTTGTGGSYAQGTPYANYMSGMWGALDNPSGFASAYTAASGLTLWPTGVTTSTNCYAYYSAGAVNTFISANLPASCL